jgi:hypothetical protein
MMPCLTDWPGFYRDITHEGIDADATYGLEKIFQDPREAWASELYRRFRVDFEKLNLKPRCGVFDEEVDTVEFEGASQWLSGL